MEPWEERFVREYRELSERTDKLGGLLNRWGHLGFEPKCPYELLAAQYDAMSAYRRILRVRAEIEGVTI